MEIWDKSIAVEEDLIKANEDLAKVNEDFFRKNNITTFEILGNIGSGKTSLIETIVSELKDKYKIIVINGDLATSIDADRIKQHGVEAIQINTGKECHLDALTIKPALEKLNEKVDLCLIEQVGNMICPADFPLGAKKRIVPPWSTVCNACSTAEIAPVHVTTISAKNPLLYFLTNSGTSSFA